MAPLVSIGIPVYKRLEYLPNALNMVRSQDYRHIELVVSDNGTNGSKVPEIADRCYSGPYRFRQNAVSVDISSHYNQIVNEASGKYFILLCDDDEISPNYASDLVGIMERHPSAAAAISSQEIIDESGTIIKRSKAELPDLVSGPDFIRAAWHTHEYEFDCFATLMARTEAIKACGGYPEFTTGTHNDDALLIKLCLQGDVALSERSCFRWRRYESSHGWSISIKDLAKATREFLEFLNSDPILVEFARENPDRWNTVREHLVCLGWKTYYWRWVGLYRRRLSTLEWLNAAFAMPFIPAYYRRVAQAIFSSAKFHMASPLRKHFPRAFELYTATKQKRFP